MHGAWHTYLISTETSSFTKWCRPSGQVKHSSLRPQVRVNRCRARFCHSNKGKQRKSVAGYRLMLGFLMQNISLLSNLLWYSAFPTEDAFGVVWFAFLLDKGMDIVSHHIKRALPRGRWGRATKNRTTLPATKDHGSVLLTGLQEPHVRVPKAPRPQFGYLDWKPTDAVSMPKAHLFEFWVQWYVSQAHSENHTKDCIYSRVTGEDLVGYEKLKDNSSAPIFKHRLHRYGDRDRNRQFLLLKFPSFKLVFSGVKGCHP